MAQDFERTLTKDIGASATDIRAEANSDDAIVGLRLANTASSTINVDVLITNSSNTTLATIIKSCPIPQGSSLELIDGGAKIVLQSGDKLRAVSDTASSLDVIVSAVDTISE